MWHEVSGNLPTDFGFPIDVHAHEPDTIYVVPIKSDSRALSARRQAPRLSQQHRRQRVGAAHQGPAAGELLRQHPPRRDGRRSARLRAASTSARPAGRSTARPTAATTGSRSSATCRACCRWKCRRCHDPRRPPLPPPHARQHQRRGAARRRRRRSRSASVLDALEARYPMLRGTIRDHVTQFAGRSCGSSPASRTSPTNRPTPRCPPPSRRARNPF